jgi:hypothetical protein
MSHRLAHLRVLVAAALLASATLLTTALAVLADNGGPPFPR